MAEVRTGLRRLLRSARPYDALQRLVGEVRVKTEFIDRYGRIRAGERVLDIGCGTGRTLDYLPAVEYLGFDPNEAYVAAARARYGARGRFVCAGVESACLDGEPRSDVVLAVAVLHHLDDAAATRLFALARERLAPGGRLVTLDAVRTPGQSAIARFLIDHDRGQNVRDEEGYVALARGVFRGVRSTVRHDLLRIPYSHIILECEL